MGNGQIELGVDRIGNYDTVVEGRGIRGGIRRYNRLVHHIGFLHRGNPGPHSHAESRARQHIAQCTTYPSPYRGTGRAGDKDQTSGQCIGDAHRPGQGRSGAGDHQGVGDGLILKSRVREGRFNQTQIRLG